MAVRKCGEKTAASPRRSLSAGGGVRGALVQQRCNAVAARVGCFLVVVGKPLSRRWALQSVSTSILALRPTGRANPLNHGSRNVAAPKGISPMQRIPTTTAVHVRRLLVPLSATAARYDMQTEP